MPFFEPFQEFGTSKGTPQGRMDVQQEKGQLEAHLLLMVIKGAMV